MGGLVWGELPKQESGRGWGGMARGALRYLVATKERSGAIEVEVAVIRPYG